MVLLDREATMVINERRELAEGFLAAISVKLRLGMAAGIDGVWIDQRWKEVDRLAVAMVDDNLAGEQWVLNYNPGIEQKELLLRGMSWLDKETLGEKKLERLLGLIDYQTIDFEVLREVFPDYETLERVKIKMGRAHLERMVPPSLARADGQGKPHL